MKRAVMLLIVIVIGCTGCGTFMEAFRAERDRIAEDAVEAVLEKKIKCTVNKYAKELAQWAAPYVWGLMASGMGLKLHAKYRQEKKKNGKNGNGGESCQKS